MVVPKLLSVEEATNESLMSSLEQRNNSKDASLNLKAISTNLCTTKLSYRTLLDHENRPSDASATRPELIFFISGFFPPKLSSLRDPCRANWSGMPAHHWPG